MGLREARGREQRPRDARAEESDREVGPFLDVILGEGLDQGGDVAHVAQEPEHQERAAPRPPILRVEGRAASVHHPRHGQSQGLSRDVQQQGVVWVGRNDVAKRHDGLARDGGRGIARRLREGAHGVGLA